MKPIQTRKFSIYFSGHSLEVEVEEYKTVWHLFFIDKSKYFSLVDTIKVYKNKVSDITELGFISRDYAISKRLF